MKKYLQVILLIVLLCLAFGCQDKASLEELEQFKAQATREEHNKEIVRRWIEEVNNENFDRLYNELWAKDCLQYMNSNPEPIDNSQFATMMKNYYENFPATAHDIHELIAKGDKVIAIFSARANHDVDSYGVPATGKELTWRAMAVFQISNGKIQTRREVADILGMYEQLGMELKPKEAGK